MHARGRTVRQWADRRSVMQPVRAPVRSDQGTVAPDGPELLAAEGSPHLEARFRIRRREQGLPTGRHDLVGQTGALRWISRPIPGNTVASYTMLDYLEDNPAASVVSPWRASSWRGNVSLAYDCLRLTWTRQRPDGNRVKVAMLRVRSVCTGRS